MIKLHFHLLLDVVYMTSRKNALKVFFYKSSGEYRGSCSKMLIKIGVLENFANFTPVLECFINKVAGLRPATLFERDSKTQVFFCETCKVFKNTYFKRTPPVTVS